MTLSKSKTPLVCPVVPAILLFAETNNPDEEEDRVVILDEFLGTLSLSLDSLKPRFDKVLLK
jgi:hypothetical protein